MYTNVTKNMFYLQTELIDAKVDMAASRAIDRVVEQISALRNEIRGELHEFREEVNQRFARVDAHFTKIDAHFTEVNARFTEVETRFTDMSHEMNQRFIDMSQDMNHRFDELNQRFSHISERVVAIETRLGMVTDVRKEIRGRMMDYIFKGGWLMLASTVSYFALKLALIIK